MGEHRQVAVALENIESHETTESHPPVHTPRLRSPLLIEETDL